MDFRLSEEQEFVRDTVRKFVAREVSREVARALDEQAAFPGELLRKLAETGFCGLNCPEEYGGGGRNLLGSAIVVEELATICPTLAGAFAQVALCGGKAISEFGSEDQKRRFLPEIARGTLLVTQAVSESAGDMLRAEVKTTAKREGDGLVLDGAKTFVPLAGQAGCILTLARTAPDAELRAGLTFLLVDAAAPGVETAEVENVGFRGASLCRLAFENVSVPSDCVLGGMEWINRGWEQHTFIKAVEQIETAALGVGIAQGAFDYAAKYAQERVQFGQPIARFEAIGHMLVDMAIDIRAARHLLYEACWRADEGQPFETAAAMAEIRAVELARRVALQGLHILGGYGFMMEYDAQRYVRDSLALLAGSEPVEVLKSSVLSLAFLSGLRVFAV